MLWQANHFRPCHRREIGKIAATAFSTRADSFYGGGRGVPSDVHRDSEGLKTSSPANQGCMKVVNRLGSLQVTQEQVLDALLLKPLVQVQPSLTTYGAIPPPVLAHAPHALARLQRQRRDCPMGTKIRRLVLHPSRPPIRFHGPSLLLDRRPPAIPRPRRHPISLVRQFRPVEGHPLGRSWGSHYWVKPARLLSWCNRMGIVARGWLNPDHARSLRLCTEPRIRPGRRLTHGRQIRRFAGKT